MPYVARWRQKSNFVEIGNFKRPSLTQQTSHSYQIFRFATQVGALVDFQILARLLHKRNKEIRPKSDSSVILSCTSSMWQIGSRTSSVWRMYSQVPDYLSELCTLVAQVGSTTAPPFG